MSRQDDSLNIDETFQVIAENELPPIPVAEVCEVEFREISAKLKTAQQNCYGMRRMLLGALTTLSEVGIDNIPELKEHFKEHRPDVYTRVRFEAAIDQKDRFERGLQAATSYGQHLGELIDNVLDTFNSLQESLEATPEAENPTIVH